MEATKPWLLMLAKTVKQQATLQRLNYQKKKHNGDNFPLG